MPESTPNSSPANRQSWLWIAVLGMMMIPGILSLLYLRSAPRKPLDSVAVLPFAHRAGEPSLESMRRRIAEELHHRLTESSGLRIAPREAAQGDLGDVRTAQEIGHELGVRAILRGHIERRGERIRIRAELLDSGDNSVLWARQYELRGEADLAAFEEELARHVVSFLHSQ